MQVYYAIVHKEKDSAFGISFPDLPGCFSAADEDEDILSQAQAALSLFADELRELPAARPIQTLLKDPDVQELMSPESFVIAVPMVRIEKKARYNLMLDTDLVANVDRLASAGGVNRSEFVSETLAKRLSVEGGTAFSIARSESTGKKAASAAGKVLASKSATKAQKSVAASALTQKGSTEKTSAKVASAASKILKSKSASKAAKSAAASALTQKTKKV